ncbi:hypothetical protein LR392_15360 [Arthrobacter sp. AK04]|uniref:hypothetical protein n=1 Tax=Arthrobacter sp. AK04 TaxID=2900048 RepID=UPI001E4FE0D9|nr:hypothetical protein [Arthrobacter sp. AK04]MCD5343602.1 hypothetical protein [Arthrobacter sp. AK04]
METVTGEFADLLRVDSNLTVHGLLSNGAEVLAGNHLVVNGIFAGPLHVGKEGFCTVKGTFTGTVSSNEGLLLLYGLVSTPLDAGFGKVVVGIDSLVTRKDGRLYTLLADGSLEAVVGDVRAGGHNVMSDKICAYEPDQDRFVPLPLDN